VVMLFINGFFIVNLGWIKFILHTVGLHIIILDNKDV